MWGSFVTGFAQEASKVIDERNKEISDRVLAEMGSLIKKKEDAEETALTKRDVARKQAEALKALAGKNLTETQIVGIINSGEADTVLKQLRQRTVGPERMKQLFIPADPNAQADLEQYLSEVGKLTGQAPVRTEMERGAFGLRSRAGEAARARGLAAAGMTEEELYQTRMARPTGVEGTLNISALLEEKEQDAPSLKELQERLVDSALDKNMTPEEYTKTEEGRKLAARIEGRRLIGATDDAEKARTTSQIKSMVTDNIRERLTSLELNKYVYFSESLGDYAVKTPGSEEAKEYASLRASVVKDVFTNAKLLSGNKLVDRNAADAISAFANVDYDTLTVKGWRSAPVAPAPASGAPASGKVTVTTPDGKKLTFNTQQEADNFKAAAGIK